MGISDHKFNLVKFQLSWKAANGQKTTIRPNGMKPFVAHPQSTDSYQAASLPSTKSASCKTSIRRAQGEFLVPCIQETSGTLAGQQNCHEPNQSRTARRAGTDLLLCAVDQLVLVGPLKARLHALIVPEFLHVIEELLRFERVTDENIQVRQSITKLKAKRLKKIFCNTHDFPRGNPHTTRPARLAFRAMTMDAYVL